MNEYSDRDGFDLSALQSFTRRRHCHVGRRLIPVPIAQRNVIDPQLRGNIQAKARSFFAEKILDRSPLRGQMTGRREDADWGLHAGQALVRHGAIRELCVHESLDRIQSLKVLRHHVGVFDREREVFL